MLFNDAYKKIINILNKPFIEEPNIEARLILQHIKKIDTCEIIANRNKIKINKSEFRQINKIIKKRLAGKSLSSILKIKSFYEYDFFVNENVLIPRPETELLIDIAVKKFNKNENINILDIGTGSGNIAIVLAKYYTNAKIDAVDINKKSLNTAKINIIKNNIRKNQINFIKKDIFKYKLNKSYNIIISNPPYIETIEVLNLINKKQISDPIIALDGGGDGLKFYRKLKDTALHNLTKDGWMIFEHGINQRKKILKIFNKDFFILECYNDLAGIDRAIALKLRG